MEFFSLILITKTQADLLMASGSLIGLYVKGLSLYDKQTVITRRSTGVNVITYPVTALLPMAVLGIWATFTFSVLTYLIWTGLYLYRAPEHEDWKGNLTLDEVKELCVNALKKVAPK